MIWWDKNRRVVWLFVATLLLVFSGALVSSSAFSFVEYLKNFSNLSLLKAAGLGASLALLFGVISAVLYINNYVEPNNARSVTSPISRLLGAINNRMMEKVFLENNTDDFPCYYVMFRPSKIRGGIDEIVELFKNRYPTLEFFPYEVTVKDTESSVESSVANYALKVWQPGRKEKQRRRLLTAFPIEMKDSLRKIMTTIVMETNQ